MNSIEAAFNHKFLTGLIVTIPIVITIFIVVNVIELHAGGKP